MFVQQRTKLMGDCHGYGQLTVEYYYCYYYYCDNNWKPIGMIVMIDVIGSRKRY